MLRPPFTCYQDTLRSLSGDRQCAKPRAVHTRKFQPCLPCRCQGRCRRECVLVSASVPVCTSVSVSVSVSVSLSLSVSACLCLCPHPSRLRLCLSVPVLVSLSVSVSVLVAVCVLLQVPVSMLGCVALVSRLWLTFWYFAAKLLVRPQCEPQPTGSAGPDDCQFGGRGAAHTDR